jgi:hypothetical protein
VFPSGQTAVNNIKGRAAAFIPPLDAFGKAEPVCVQLNYMPMEYTDGCAKNMYFSFCRQCINNDDNNMAARRACMLWMKTIP